MTAEFTAWLNLIVMALGLVGLIFTAGRGFGNLAAKLESQADRMLEHTTAIKELQGIVLDGLSTKVAELERIAKRTDQERDYQGLPRQGPRKDKS
jgi:hypothetical protein